MEAKDEKKRDLPLVETTFSLLNNYMATLMFIWPALLKRDAAVYTHMDMIAPAPVWGLAFLLTGLIGAWGLYTCKEGTRRLALLLTAFLYAVIGVCYAIGFPNFGTGIYFILAFIAFESRDVVRTSEL